MAQLPEDLIVEILVRLPVKPLLRFRCLSKPSCAVIDSTNFIKSHLGKSSQNGKLILTDLSNKKFHVCDVNHNLEDEIQPDSSLVGEVGGFCNGLLLLVTNKIEFSMYNPSTRQRRDLPRCPFERKIGSGLGYDESIDDYKAVVIEVVAFDVSKEMFGSVSQPVLVKSFPILHVLEGCLCISYCNSCRPIRADIYMMMMMKNDGVDTFTWTQLHSVEKPFKSVDVLEHSKGRYKILLDLGYGWDSIVSYDLQKKIFVKVEMNKDPGWTAPIHCHESLVPVGS